MTAVTIAHILVVASQAENSHIVSILLNRNYGQHSAIMAGFSHVTGDLIITLDADLQNPPEEIPAWWQKPMKVTTWRDCTPEPPGQLVSQNRFEDD